MKHVILIALAAVLFSIIANSLASAIMASGAATQSRIERQVGE